ncbi:MULTISPECIES: hypothetical protein [Weeksellaceae]|uniref:Lipoprotein n=1 Tax=Elizabethkingia occulta TaxID=1867263 RepID=A0A1T3MMX7_9FLAO|nr:MULTISPECIES: hypothetical protein [Weeksellaceae]OPC65924.1 hypothetical protein BAZ10_01430 [Elizabethkingia occulta]
MRNYIALITVLVFLSCTKTNVKVNDTSNTINETKQQLKFRALGNKNLSLFNFPKHWTVQVFDEGEPMTKEDSLYQKNMDQLDFFDDIKGKSINDNTYKKALLDSDKKEKIDSLFLIDSYSIENKQIVYLKYYKTINDSNYDFPPSEKNIDVLIYDQNNLVKRLNVYSSKNYPSIVEKKIGYLDELGTLFMKTFEIDEEGVTSTTNKTINCKEYLK